MSGFSVAWLDLRESADMAARNRPLVAQALRWLETGTTGAGGAAAIVVDLGAGTGSTLRALTALGAGKLVWRLVDHDGALLDEALRRHRRTCLIEDYQADLTVADELPLGGARLVTASALFDLASRRFIAALVRRLEQSGAGQAGATAAGSQASAAGRVAHAAADLGDGPSTGLYAALNYDGTTAWTPVHPLDSAVLDAFNRDQRRDKGLGPALGPDAVGHLQHMLTNAGLRVFTGPSPWQLGPADAALVEALIRGMANAVAGDYGLDRQALQDWESFRLNHAASGTCTVGHQDLLALPWPQGEDCKRA